MKKRKYYKDPVEAFWSRTKKTKSCWLWTGGKSTCGYGTIRFRGKTIAAHRLSYFLFHGKFPTKSKPHIDHLCRMRHCVNPKHLEAVTNRENILRGNGTGAQHSRKKKCLNGHDLTKAENLYRSKKEPNRRICKECSKKFSRAYYRSNRKKPRC